MQSGGEVVNLAPGALNDRMGPRFYVARDFAAAAGGFHAYTCQILLFLRDKPRLGLAEGAEDAFEDRLVRAPFLDASLLRVGWR